MSFPVVAEDQIPPLAVVRQRFARAADVDIEATVEQGLAAVAIEPGERIAVATGSRGIVDIARTVKAVVTALRRRGAEPFIIPAMGSHGGATPEGQTAVLANYGVTPESCGAPIEAAMTTRLIGETPAGLPVHMAETALAADGVVVVNRVKPHTDFGGPYGSGLLKMMAIGLGKQTGAGALHRAAARRGLGQVVADVGTYMVAHANVRAGVALIENALHQVAHVEVVPGDLVLEREPALQTLARESMARLPFEEIDLLIVDRLGKDISGTGMDPNVIGRIVHGYNSSLAHAPNHRPIIWRILVRDLTPATHGNVSGIGMADFTTLRVKQAFDAESSHANALTSLSIQSVKMPIAFANDRVAVRAALSTLGLPDPRSARVVRIRDTLNLHTLEVSPACLQDGLQDGVPDRLDLVTPPRPMQFDANDNLADVAP